MFYTNEKSKNDSNELKCKIRNPKFTGTKRVDGKYQEIKIPGIDNIFDSIGFNQNRMTSKEEFAYFYAWLRGQIRVIANKYNDAKAKQPPKKPVKATKKA